MSTASRDNGQPRGYQVGGLTAVRTGVGLVQLCLGQTIVATLRADQAAALGAYLLTAGQSGPVPDVIAPPPPALIPASRTGRPGRPRTIERKANQA